MQYSTNSDEAIKALIRACPTPVGQYRQAVLQARDRAIALQQYDLTRKRHEHQIAIKKAEREQVLGTVANDVLEAQIRANKAALLELDIQEIEFGIKATDQLVADAEREMRVCHQEITRIQQESGIQFDKLSEVEFQVLMAEEFQQKRMRWIAARSLAAQMMIPESAAEAFLEIPTNERVAYFRRHAEVLEEFHQSLDQFVTERKQLNVSAN